jgi:hypothetical protein
MHPCHIIPTHLFFPASYLLSFPASLFTPWPPEAKKDINQNVDFFYEFSHNNTKEVDEND